MPFPPNFTDLWDITQPPDTQLANLLGQDIRNLKLDIMQRLSLLSGTLANRPTPEVVNATWGGAGFGITYLATDTGQLFQWNGAAWIQVPFGAQKYSDYNSHALVVNGVGTQTGNSIAIPIGGLEIGSQVSVTARCLFNYTSGVAPVISLVCGTQTLFTGGLNAGNNGEAILDLNFGVSANAVEVGIAEATFGPNGFSFVFAYNDTVNISTTALTIKTQVQGFATSNATVTFDFLNVLVNF